MASDAGNNRVENANCVDQERGGSTIALQPQPLCCGVVSSRKYLQWRVAIAMDWCCAEVAGGLSDGRDEAGVQCSWEQQGMQKAFVPAGTQLQ
jgi:hypothetical protein